MACALGSASASRQDVVSVAREVAFPVGEVDRKSSVQDRQSGPPARTRKRIIETYREAHLYVRLSLFFLSFSCYVSLDTTDTSTEGVVPPPILFFLRPVLLFVIVACLRRKLLSLLPSF